MLNLELDCDASKIICVVNVYHTLAFHKGIILTLQKLMLKKGDGNAYKRMIFMSIDCHQQWEMSGLDTLGRALTEIVVS